MADENERNDVLEAALDYYGRCWSIFPLEPGSKDPLYNKYGKSMTWKKYKTKRASLEQVKRWFADENRGIGILPGPVSGGFLIRDFDTAEAYDDWKMAHGELAATLPTVKTGKGYHVYFKADLPEGLKKCCYIKYKEKFKGELRLKDFVAAPPTIHPETKQRYRWVVPPGDTIPKIDLWEAGFLFEGCFKSEEKNNVLAATLHRNVDIQKCSNVDIQKCSNVAIKKEKICGEEKENPIANEKLEIDDILFLVSEEGKKIVLPFLKTEECQNVIELEMPKAIGERNEQVFELARALKWFDHLKDLPPTDLFPIVLTWFNTGLERGVIGTESWEVTAGAFSTGWKNVHLPKKAGSPSLSGIKDLAEKRLIENPPKIIKLLTDERYKFLVCICAELQSLWDEKPFPFSCHVAGKMIGVSHTFANNVLNYLITIKVLEMVEEHDRKNKKARLFRYLMAD